MIIRQAQVATFEDAAEAGCIAYTNAFVRQNASETVTELAPEVFDERIRKGINLARDYELDVFADIAAFVYFLFKVGPNFHELPFFQSVLTDEELDPDDRMTVLVESASDEDWFEAHDMSDQTAWERLG
jgi:hypothetical protein